jgi:hypothetical protein
MLKSLSFNFINSASIGPSREDSCLETIIQWSK